MTKRYFSESIPKGSPNKDLSDILSGLKKDDLIILGIVLILLGEGCRDKELLLMLGFLFISDKPGILNNLL